MTDFQYSGCELPLMAQAVHWRRYVAHLVRPYLGAAVLEVGAGIGNNIPALLQPRVRQLTALEPDAAQAAQITDPRVRVMTGTMATLPAHEMFDAILYLDVLEHIEDDRREMTLAALHLLPGGHVIVLAPAHPSLFSPMDTAVGHYRRYTAAGLRALTPAGCWLERLCFVDALGLFASVANRFMLRTPQMSQGQVQLWDRVLVRLSRIVDPLLLRRLGKSAFAVWRRAPA